MRIVLLVALLYSLACNDGAERTGAISAEDFSSLDSLLLQFLDEAKLPGVSVAVQNDNQIIYQKAFGYADIEKGVRMTSESRLRTGSVAKIITATALGRLVTKGELDLDEPISTYVPYLKAPFADLTTRQLAGHTSGVVHRPPWERLTNTYYSDIRETVALFEDTELSFTPGTDYEYSTNGYNLLSAVIEGVTGTGFRQFMQAEIFGPLKMADTFVENISELTRSDTKLYYFDDGALKLDSELIDGTYKVAGAGFRSTPTDLVRMMQAYSTGFVSEETVAEMFTSNILANGESTNVGIGWRTSYDPFGRTPVDHAGSWQGARTVVVYYPEEKLSVAIMINAQCQIFIEELGHLVAQYFLDDEVSSTTVVELYKDVSVTNNRSNGTVEYYDGSLVLNQSGTGRLEINTDVEFLKSNPVRFLGKENRYALVSQYGALYMRLVNQPEFEGTVYMYQNRNSNNPVEGRPTLSFREQ